MIIQPVVIPALKPTLDPSLVQDKSFCPVRALKCYLDKKKISGRERNYFLWLLRRAYQKSLQEVQNVSQVNEHDVRALDTFFLAFKGRVSLDESMVSCFWQSHSTFTNFYLKDLCWHNGDVIKIGAVVAAQRVVIFFK